MSYTVGVGRNWYGSTGNPAPNHTCGHAHRTAEAAQRCADKLYGAKYVRGNWQANAQWHDAYIVGPTGAKVQ